jgi:prophage tail gpP-like protein
MNQFTNANESKVCLPSDTANEQGDEFTVSTDCSQADGPPKLDLQRSQSAAYKIRVLWMELTGLSTYQIGELIQIDEPVDAVEEAEQLLAFTRYIRDNAIRMAQGNVGALPPPAD